MLNKHDLVKSLHVSIKEIAYMHAKQILPEPIRLDGVCYWREQDIKLFKRYLRRRSRCRQAGIDPDSAQGPAVPVYSTIGPERFDPRLVVAAEQERERRKRSRTLAAGTQPIAQPERVELPELSDAERAKG